MAMARKRVVILGSGVTGLTAAWPGPCRESNRTRLLSWRPRRSLGGWRLLSRRTTSRLTLASHRLHEDCDPEALALIKELCDADSLRRERSGLIFLQGKALRIRRRRLILFSGSAPRRVALCRGFFRARLHARAVADQGEDFEISLVKNLGRVCTNGSISLTRLSSTAPRLGRSPKKRPQIERVSLVWRAFMGT